MYVYMICMNEYMYVYMYVCMHRYVNLVVFNICDWFVDLVKRFVVFIIQ